MEPLAHRVENHCGLKGTPATSPITAEFIPADPRGLQRCSATYHLLYASLCHGAVGGVCRSYFMPELITDVYNKFAAGDLQGSLEAQFKLNPRPWPRQLPLWPPRTWPGLRPGCGRALPAQPPHPEGPAREGFRRTMSEAGLI